MPQQTIRKFLSGEIDIAWILRHRQEPAMKILKILKFPRTGLRFPLGLLK